MKVESFVHSDSRTRWCGSFTAADVGENVTVCGWVQRQRDLGSLIFIDLRDRTGIVQLAFDDATDRAVFDDAFAVRTEYVLSAKGVVRRRGDAAVNKNLPTGEVEIAVTSMKVLSAAQTPPFEIVENSNVRPELRLLHRYLDLRRPDLQRRLIARSEIAAETRAYFRENGFVDIETPCLIKPSPEGARDYLVPSRVHPGNFYALPQSPQLYKQLLMYSGFDRYIQLARCFRDEDLRADRQPEFTQIDMEISFADEETIMAINEGYIRYIYEKCLGEKIETPFPRMKYAEAMERYGSDKPDIRFGFELTNLTDIAASCGFKVFSGAVAEGGAVRGICVKGGAKFSRKEIDAITETAKQYRAKGVAWYKSAAGEVSSSYAKFLTQEENEAILTRLGFEDGDLALIVADAKAQVTYDALGALRIDCARRLGLLDPKDRKFLWVTEFPMFEYSEEEDRYVAKHHPFTMPMEEDLDRLESDPGSVRARAYDIVLNGTELGGGSVRIHTTDLQQRVFRALKISPETAEEKFGYLLEAFKYGVPPHCGLAFGLDRFVALAIGVDDIRDVIAFPKVQNASELMSKAPGPADPGALAELHLAITE